MPLRRLRAALARLRRRPPTAPVPKVRTADDVIAAVAAALTPRTLVTFGLPAPACRIPGCHLVTVDPPVPAASGSDSIDAFFARPHGASADLKKHRRPTVCDLAVVSASYPDATLDHILTALGGLAHSRTTLLLIAPAPGDGDTAALATRLARLRPGLALQPVAAVPPAVLAAGLDLPAGTSEDAPESFDAFVARFRIRPTPSSQALAPAGDAPRHPGERIMPRYTDIAGVRDLQAPAARNKRAIGTWWGQPLDLLPLTIATAEAVGFVAADGIDRAVLVGADGLPLAASYREQGGYGVATAPTIYRAPSHVRDAARRRHPLHSARDLLTGPVVAGDFLLLGPIDPRFGHFMTESLARGWAVQWGLERGMRILAWGKPAPYQREALALLGIDRKTLVLAERGAIYQRLHIPDLGYRLMGSIARAQGAAFRRMAAAAGRAPSESAGRFLYLSRRGVSNRLLTNEAELERLLIERGGIVLQPETLSLTEQIRRVAAAPAIVGCTGSQLHLSMFQRPGTTKLVIGTEHFLGPDEMAFAIASGAVIDHYVQPADRALAPAARTAPWTLDLERFLPAFDEWLATLPDAATIAGNAG